MKTKVPTVRAFFAVKYLSVAALAVLFALAVQAQETFTSVQSGDWNSGATWDLGTPPTVNNNVSITGGDSIDYITGSTPNLRLLYIGAGTGTSSSPDVGTLQILGGTMTLNRNDAAAISVGRSDYSVGTLNIAGGTLRGGNTSGISSGMQIAFGANSTGTVNLSSGTIALNSGLVVGVGNGSTGTLNVTGGTITTSSGTGTSIGPFNIGARVANVTATAIYKQSGGSVSVHSSQYFGVGYSLSASNVLTSTAEITGGTLNANVQVGREAAVTSGGGTGTLTIGSAADVNGLNQSWLVSGTGEIVFKLGSTAAFNAVDLTAATATALTFTQAGAKLTVDGSSLIFGGEESISITLMTFDTNAGSDAIVGLQNVIYGYNGFAPGYAQSLEWTNSALILNLTAVPEPSTVALAIAAGLGWVVIRRRRC